MSAIHPIADNHDQIIFETGQAQPHIFVLFYSQYDPNQYHKNIGCPKCVEMPRKNFDFGKYHFRNIYWPEDKDLANTLFVGSTYSLPEQDIQFTPNALIIEDVTDFRGDFISRLVETK